MTASVMLVTHESTGASECYQWATHSEGVYDHVLGFQLSLQDTEESEQLHSAESLHIHLLILGRQRRTVNKQEKHSLHYFRQADRY